MTNRYPLTAPSRWTSAHPKGGDDDEIVEPGPVLSARPRRAGRGGAGLSATLAWAEICAVAAWVNEHEGCWGEAGRAFLATHLGELVREACGRVLPRLLGPGEAVTTACRVLTAAVGEALYAFYARWLAPDWPGANWQGGGPLPGSA